VSRRGGRAALGARAFLAALIFATLACPVVTSAAPAPIALGVNIARAPGDRAPLNQYARLAGKDPAIVMWYQSWSEPLFYRDQLRHVKAIGAIPMITWDPLVNGVGIPFTEIAAGEYDGYIRKAARAAARWRHPMLIRFAHEMNLPGSPFGPGHDGDTPTTYVAAWRQIVRIFRRQHAKNVEWVWSPNVDCGGKCPFKAFYPGNAWVDWTALDGYNYSAAEDQPWESFAKVFGRSYSIVTKLSHKPVIVGETASAQAGGDKAKWIARAFREIPHRFPRIRAVIWFDQVKETDWQVNSSPASLAAWRLVVASETYAGTAGALLSTVPIHDDVDSRRHL
jgi:Glycosyl hydrolase family 26